MFAGSSTQILGSFHENKNVSITITVSEKKAENTHSVSTKYWFHGTHMQFFRSF